MAMDRPRIRIGLGGGASIALASRAAVSRPTGDSVSRGRSGKGVL